VTISRKAEKAVLSKKQGLRKRYVVEQEICGGGGICGEENVLGRRYVDDLRNSDGRRKEQSWKPERL
jgi:hypothetical protein